MERLFKPASIFLLLFSLTFILFITQLFVLNGVTLLEKNPIAIDFLAFYTGGKIFTLSPMNLYNLEVQQAVQQQIAPITVTKNIFLPFLNPPFVAFFFSMLSSLPLSVAYTIWIIINIVILFLLCLGCIKQFNEYSLYLRILFVLGIIFFIPLLTALLIGQLSFVVTGVILATWLFLKKKQYFLSGIILSLLLIKPHFFLLPAAVFLIQRQWKIICGILCGSLFLLIISLLFVGFDGFKSYLILLHNAASWNEGYGIDIKAQHSLQTILLIITGSNSLESIRALWIVFSCFFVLPMLFIWWKKYDYTSAAFALQFALLLLTMLLVSPHTHFHDLMILLIVGTLVGYAVTKEKLLLKTKIIPTILIFYAAILSGYIVELYFITSSRPAWVITTVFFMALLWFLIFQQLRKRLKL